jgi:hypothetical protein
MREVISKLAHCISWLAVVLTAIASFCWFSIVRNGDGWGGLAFVIIVAPWLGGASLLLGVIPSTVLYFQKRQRRDLFSLWMSGCSCLAVGGETAVLCVVRLHAC